MLRTVGMLATPRRSAYLCTIPEEGQSVFFRKPLIQNDTLRIETVSERRLGELIRAQKETVGLATRPRSVTLLDDNGKGPGVRVRC